MTNIQTEEYVHKHNIHMCMSQNLMKKRGQELENEQGAVYERIGSGREK